MLEMVNGVVDQPVTARTPQTEHELNYYPAERLERLKTSLKSIAPELLEKVTKENPNASLAQLTDALIKGLRDDAKTPGGRTHGLAQLYLNGTPPSQEVIVFLGESGGELTTSAIKFLELLGARRETFGDKSAIESVQAIQALNNEEKLFKGDLALRTALERAFPAKVNSEMSTEEANKILLGALKEAVAKNSALTSPNNAHINQIREFLQSNTEEMTPQALIALRAHTAHNAIDGLPLAGQGNAIVELITSAGDSRGWKYNQTTSSYTNTESLSSDERNYFSNRQTEALTSAISQISPLVAQRVRVMGLTGAEQMSAFVTEFRKEANNPEGEMTNLISEFRRLDPKVETFLGQTGGDITPEFLATLDRFATNQASRGNSIARNAIATYQSEVKAAATYDTDLNVKIVLDTLFPSKATQNTESGLATYQAIEAMVPILRAELSKMSSLLLQPGSTYARVVRSFLESKSNDINADTLGALRAYASTQSTPPLLAAGKITEFNTFLDAAAAQRGLRFDSARFSYM